MNRLGKAVPDALGVALGDELGASLRRLARHYIPSRYPDALPGDAPSAYYSDQDAKAARTDALGATAAVGGWWAGLLEEQRSEEEAGGAAPTGGAQ